ncbi:hypothetical protein SEA_KNOCKER_94 [Mycobacterium phage Knocker]|nr:hypothetical protein SEA_KNOCKER_94 [Mycobacterium phage Knocker]
MRWHRETPGSYTAGAYRVEHHDHAGGFWTASGPCVATVSHGTKADAQEAAFAAVMQRLGNPFAVDVVAGDVVAVGDRRGVVKAVFPGTHHPVYSILFSRGKRLCLDRHEFRLVAP